MFLDTAEDRAERKLLTSMADCEALLDNFLTCLLYTSLGAGSAACWRLMNSISSTITSSLLRFWPSLSHWE